MFLMNSYSNDLLGRASWSKIQTSINILRNTKKAKLSQAGPIHIALTFQKFKNQPQILNFAVWLGYWHILGSETFLEVGFKRNEADLIISNFFYFFNLPHPRLLPPHHHHHWIPQLHFS